jgi:hypothetical protein
MFAGLSKRIRTGRLRDERPVQAVPLAVCVSLLAVLCAQAAWSLAHPLLRPSAADLLPAPSVMDARMSSLNEPLAYAKLMNLALQTHDNQPGVSLPFKRLDYSRVRNWLERILELDPDGQYPLLAASRLYAGVDDPARQRIMLEFVHEQFRKAPNQRWQWLAHGAYVAKHQLRDPGLAVRYAESLRLYATASDVPAWARQMEIFLRAEMNQTDAAKVLLGALLASGQVTDATEFRFLSGRLKELEALAPALAK